MVQTESYLKLKNAVIKALCYFDIFDYPLTKEEIYSNIEIESTESLVFECIDELLRDGKISLYLTHYSMKNAEDKYKMRIKREQPAQSFLKKGQFMTRIISNFPFVRAVFISGSLSKLTVDDDGDIDYFIITAENRLWLTKTLLILFKRVFLLNSKKYFCLNFFVSENNQLIKNQNQYTATEISYLLPCYNPELAAEFFYTNAWTNNYFPNFRIRNINLYTKELFKPLKRLGEFLLNNNFGNTLERVCQKKHVQHKRRKFEHIKARKFEHQFKSEANISNHFPVDHQSLVLEALDEKTKSYK